MLITILVSAALKATAIALAALVALRLARRNSAAARHMIVVTALGAMILLPAFSLLLPPIAVRALAPDPAPIVVAAPAIYPLPAQTESPRSTRRPAPVDFTPAPAPAGPAPSPHRLHIPISTWLAGIW